jgi:hypothetical protein
VEEEQFLAGVKLKELLNIHTDAKKKTNCKNASKHGWW